MCLMLHNRFYRRYLRFKTILSREEQVWETARGACRRVTRDARGLSDFSKLQTTNLIVPFILPHPCQMVSKQMYMLFALLF